jgi:hypothetical protein
MEQEEHEVYGADIPDEEVDMDADIDAEHQEGDEELASNHTTKVRVRVNELGFGFLYLRILF